MATLTRQPFAPLNSARLQSLSCHKNRQNGLAGKRKASQIDVCDAENIDPVFSFKKAKASELTSPAKSLAKPSSFVLKPTKMAPLSEVLSLSSPAMPVSARRTLQPKSQAAKLQMTSQAKANSSPIPAPAGRSPTLGKRAGLLSSRRSTNSYTRVNPPALNLPSSSTPFSLDAALKGTICNRSAVSRRNKGKGRQSSLSRKLESKAGWFFDIHEDTKEQEMTNLLQHSTCVLDISSDEESERKAIREREDGFDKENIPPPDDASQTAVDNKPRRSSNSAIEKDRVILREMDVADFYGPGCDAKLVVFVNEEEEETEVEDNLVLTNFEFAPKLNNTLPELVSADLDEVITKPSEGSSKAAVLQPIEGTEECFELWESGSTKDEVEATV